MEGIIRYAHHSDADVIAGFQLKMALETEQLELDPEVVKLGVTSVLNDSSKGFYLVFEEAGRVAGCLMITKEWSDWRARWVWWIQSLYVLPGLRQKGIFKRMYDYLVSVLERDPDVAGIRLYVDRTNIRARKVYEAIGMDGEHYQLFEWMKG